ncbi:MAG: 3-hydroxybutyryl-CoA dehydrogenase [Syntrophobacterales bacterium]|jgi:3-hydroxybutyryl-CoA dehydrogenase
MKIEKVAVLGAGIMGSGIAQVVAAAGFDVTMRDIEDRFVEKGLATIKHHLDRAVEKEKITAQEATATMARIKGTTDVREAAGEADFVIEAVIEVMSVKKEVFAELDTICKGDALLASNTSGLSITEIASSTGRPDKVIGVHFFNPAPVMQLVELIRGFVTSDDTFAITRGFIEQLGKTAIEVKESPGFAVNRILCPMINEAIFAYSEAVASAEDIDQAMVLGANHPIGPLALADLVGLDTLLAVLEGLHSEMGEDKYRPAPLLRKMVRAGHFGRKSAKGFYDYNI